MGRFSARVPNQANGSNMCTLCDVLKPRGRPLVPSSCICAATPYKTALITAPTTAQYPYQPRLPDDNPPFSLSLHIRIPIPVVPLNTQDLFALPFCTDSLTPPSVDNAAHFGGSFRFLRYCYRRSDSQLCLRSTSCSLPCFPERAFHSVSHRQSTSLKTNNVQRPIAMSRPALPKNDPSSANSMTLMSTILMQKSNHVR